MVGKQGGEHDRNPIMKQLAGQALRGQHQLHSKLQSDADDWFLPFRLISIPSAAARTLG